MIPERTMHKCGFCHSENFEALTAEPQVTHCWRCGARFEIPPGSITGYAPQLLWAQHDAAYERRSMATAQQEGSACYDSLDWL